MQSDIHPSNLTLIHGPVINGTHEGQLRTWTAAEWMARWSHNWHVQIAIRTAHDRENGAQFRAGDGTFWHLRPAE